MSDNKIMKKKPSFRILVFDDHQEIEHLFEAEILLFEKERAAGADDHRDQGDKKGDPCAFRNSLKDSTPLTASMSYQTHSQSFQESMHSLMSGLALDVQ